MRIFWGHIHPPESFSNRPDILNNKYSKYNKNDKNDKNDKNKNDKNCKNNG